MQKFLGSNETIYRLARTILQGIIGVLIAYIDVLIGIMAIPNELRPMIVALVMAVLSPIMSELGKNSQVGEQDTYNTEDFLDMVGYDYEDQNDLSEEQ